MLIRAYVVLFYYVPNQNKVFLPIIIFIVLPVCQLHHVEANVLLIKKKTCMASRDFFHFWVLRISLPDRKTVPFDNSSYSSSKYIWLLSTESKVNFRFHDL